jgi:hypothetical protein
MGPGIVIAGTPVLAFILVIFARLRRRRKTQRLKRLFGPEYDRVVLEQQGDSHRAEAVLADRENELARDELLDPVWDEMYDTSGNEPASDLLLEPTANEPVSDGLLGPAANALPEPAIIEPIDAKRRRAARGRAS